LFLRAIVTRAGPAATIVDIERHSPNASVYNFEVADSHTYFVGKTGKGLWVHNASAPQFEATLTMPNNSLPFVAQNGQLASIDPPFQAFLDSEGLQARITCAESNVVNQAFNAGSSASDFEGAQLTVTSLRPDRLNQIARPCSEACEELLKALKINVTPGGW
jgi:hypothetical protein